MTNATRLIVSCVVIGATVTVVDSPSRAGHCPGSGFGCNSATVGDGTVFDELNVTPQKGLPKRDQRDFGLTRAFFPRTADRSETTVQLKVRGDDLIAHDAANNTYEGRTLGGLIIEVANIDGRTYEIQVERACSGGSCGTAMAFWVEPKNEAARYYELKVRKTHRKNKEPNAPSTDCKRTPDDGCAEKEFVNYLCDGEHLDPGLWQGFEHAAVIFAGDRYNAATKTVEDIDPKRGWFNLACTGTAVAKMHLLRHTHAGGPPGRLATVQQRTTMLKMITADYCGDGGTLGHSQAGTVDGSRWTADGTPLLYTDAKGWYPATGDLETRAANGYVEAIWGPTGALCLNEPRRKPGHKPVDGCTPPAVLRSEVVSACARNKYPWDNMHGRKWSSQIPECGSGWLDWWSKNKTTSDDYVMSVISPQAKPAMFCSQLSR